MKGSVKMIFVNILGYIMSWLYNIFGNYGIAIIMFTLVSKIILLPISIIVQKNSIKMVKMQPDLNRIKINFYGDKDRIAEEQAKLYKVEKYNAFESLIPLVIQIALLFGLVQVINKPLTYITNIDKNKINEIKNVAIINNNLNEEDSSIELAVVEDIKNSVTLEKYNEHISNDEIAKIKNINLKFLGFDLSWVAAQEHGISILIPLIAGISAMLMCIAQNIMNVLQAEQTKFNKYGMLILSVLLSLYLGYFVSAGVALYWTASNLMAILQQWLLNIFINPKKAVNYKDLEETRNELNKLNKMAPKKTKEQTKKEKEDYKKFFSIVNKHLVFYSEGNGFYKYFKGIIEYILKNTNITIHYITSDYNDNIFNLEKENPQIKAYYIDEKKLITLMMKMDADVVVMTMPDLQNFHIKRSYVRNDIEYIYIPHGLDSLNLTMRTASMNAYDTVFATGKHQKEEMLATNKLYDLKNRTIFEWGYSLLDDMISNYHPKMNSSNINNILIAPSWQKDNIVDLCLNDILDNLKNTNYKVIVRPHPQQVKHMKEKFEQMKADFENNSNITIETDFSSSDSIFNADVMITDWSAIAYEYAYTTKRPVIFIDTPMKIMNPDYKKINIEPFNIWCRNIIGEVVPVNQINEINNVIKRTLENKDKYTKEITDLLNNNVYNLGSSSEKGATYIIKIIQKKIKERKNSK